MANRKISDLTALTTPATGDLLPIVDISEAAAADKNKKITFGELFASIPLGTAAAPSVAFEGYPGSGVYSSGANQVAFTTNGTGRLFVDASGSVGIATATPNTALEVNGTIRSGTGSGEILAAGSIDVGKDIGLADGQGIVLGSARRIAISSTGTTTLNAAAATAPFIANIGASEVHRIDSSGRLLVGGSTDSGGALLQVFGDRIKIGTAKTPASATATGTTGEIAWDANYIYVCTATNTWKRTAISTW